MKFVKRNKFTLIVIVLFILLVIAGVKVKDFLVPNLGIAIYGNRLDGIESVSLKNELFDTIKEKIVSDQCVNNLTYDIRGKLINFTMYVTDNLGVEDAKVVAARILDHFSEQEKAFYDIQVFVVKEDKALNDFPIIGYKHTSSNQFIFTKTRSVSES